MINRLTSGIYKNYNLCSNTAKNETVNTLKNLKRELVVFNALDGIPNYRQVSVVNGTDGKVNQFTRKKI